MDARHATPRRYAQVVIGSHLILHGYGHWLPNDPRGSGSEAIREEKLADLGPLHTGRRTTQPPHKELRRFYRQAEPRLDAKVLWFDPAKRQAVGEAFARVAADCRYTVWACAILANHAHLCVRRHRDDPVTVWRAFAERSIQWLRRFADVPADHRVWSSRPYKVFLHTPDQVRRVVHYIQANPAKEGLEPQNWPWIRPYDGWPHPRQE